MEQRKIKKIKKRGDFYVTKVDVKKSVIHGVYFDKKYERLVKLRDRQAYVWFSIFAILETLLRPYIFEIVLGLSVVIVLANLAFHFLFIGREKKEHIQVLNSELYDVVDKKHRAWRQTFTMAIVFVCLARLIIFIQPGSFSDFNVTTVYCISLVVSFFTIIVWLYYGGLKNQLKLTNDKVKKKHAKKINA